MVASLIALGREAGDSQVRAVLWPHMLVTERGKNRLLTLTWLSEPGTAAFSAPLPGRSSQLYLCGVGFVQVSQGDAVTVTSCGFNREKGKAEVMC